MRFGLGIATGKKLKQFTFHKRIRSTLSLGYTYVYQ